MEAIVSVRNFVEFILQSGSIDNRYAAAASALDGTRLHKKIQNRESKKEGYEAEVTLKYDFKYKDLNLKIQGRADGIYTASEVIRIHEIKSTKKNIAEIEVNNCHLAQAKIYAYIYGKLNSEETIQIEINYINVDSELEKIFEYSTSLDELDREIMGWIKDYYDWVKARYEFSLIRNESIKALQFPFKTYRDGQRKLAVGVYRTIIEKRRLLVSAPTGIGKTISTLYPSIKSIGEKKADKIFYLTAKTIGRKVAVDTLNTLKNNGLSLKTVILSAKEKICLNNEVSCNPIKCIYADGYYDKVKKVLAEILDKEDLIDADVLIKYSERYKVCPFELGLDLSLWVDCIVGDYNYVFDPKVQLKRFFEDVTEKYIFLVDESHNLLDRARSMYSAELSKGNVLEIKKLLNLNSDKKLKKAINKLHNILLDFKKEVQESNDSYIIQEIKPEAVYYSIYNILKECDVWLNENIEREGYEKVLELYFTCHSYSRIYEYFGENYKVYNYLLKGDLIHKLFCIDPSEILNSIYAKSESTILFSATLEPINYYKEVLGSGENSFTMLLESPFDNKKCLGLITNNIKTTYGERASYYSEVAHCIKEVITKYKGNYFAFFPSYAYLEEIKALIEDMDCNIIVQEREMSEEDRLNFLSHFESKNQPTLGLAVNGGIFAEGIDLEGDKLKGVFIIGVGLPKINVETDLIKDYFNAKIGKGYEYAYMYPGFNKVLQAGGRVIRSESDKGSIFLMDERFSNARYFKLYPNHWKNFKIVYNRDDINSELEKFWLEKNS